MIIFKDPIICKLSFCNQCILVVWSVIKPDAYPNNSMLTHKAMYSTTLPFLGGRLRGKKIKPLLQLTLTCTTKFMLTVVQFPNSVPVTILLDCTSKFRRQVKQARLPTITAVALGPSYQCNEVQCEVRKYGQDFEFGNYPEVFGFALNDFATQKNSSSGRIHEKLTKNKLQCVDGQSIVIDKIP